MTPDEIRQHLKSVLLYKNISDREAAIHIGKNPSYINKFILYGTPKRLPEPERKKLAQYLNIPEQELTDLPISTLNQAIKKEDFYTLLSLLNDWMEKEGVSLNIQEVTDYIFWIYDKVRIEPKEAWQEKVIFLADARRDILKEVINQ